MNEYAAALFTALAAGLLGSGHCIAMCSGISGLAAASAVEKNLRLQWRLALTYNGGRLLSYAALGTLAATLGAAAIGVIPGLVGPVRVFGGLLIILIGLQIAFDLRALRVIERAGASLWRAIAPLARGLLPVSSPWQALGLGLLWGLLPCGLVYSVLLLSISTASTVHGALTMLAFGAGTVPAMLATGLGAARLSNLIAGRGVRVAAGLLVIAAGALTLLFPVLSMLTTDPAAAGHQHIG